MNRKSKTINLMKYIIIGLGNYGHVLAEELSALGHEVIGADISSSRVDGLKDKIATAFVIDATDEQALSVLPLNSVDVVIVAIGENFGASIRVVALLKQKKVKRIYARAIDAIHRSVLDAFGLERILTPEEDAARGLVHLLEFGADIETFRVDANYYVVKFTLNASAARLLFSYANENASSMLMVAFTAVVCLSFIPEIDITGAVLSILNFTVLVTALLPALSSADTVTV